MRQLLLRRIPLMTLLCSILGLAGPLPEAFAKGGYEYYQQSTALKTVLNQISSHYKVAILFEDNLIQGKTTNYRFDPSRTTLDKALLELLTPLGLKASKVNEENYAIVAVAPKKTPNGDPSRKVNDSPGQDQVADKTPANATVMQQGSNPSLPTDNPGGVVTIRGRVVSTEKEQPIPGVNVTVKDTHTGTTTDAEGYFILKTPATKPVLTFGHVNYFLVEQAYNGQGNMIVKLKTIVKEMSEVVVETGLFKRARENFTGATTTVTGEELRMVNSVNVLDALKIFDPSVRIPDNVQFGSDPNKLPTITLRGTNNFPQQTTGTAVSASGADFMTNYANNPNQPLFILDGFEVSLQKIYDLDNTRIASITVLKDASATSIYGSRAANGVIVIDTKQPMPGKLRVSYSGMTQITAPDLTVYDLTNASEKLELERLAGIYSVYTNGLRPDADAIVRELYASRLSAVQKGANTYWLSQPVTTGIGQRHSLYLEGGDNYIRYGINLGYNNTAGVMKNSSRNTYNGGMNISYRHKGLLFKNSLSVAFNKGINSNYGSFGDYTKMNQYWSPYDSNGNIVKIVESVINPVTPSAITSYYNPLYNTTLNTIDQTQYSSIMNQTKLEWQMGKGFRLTGNMQIMKQNDQSDYFLPAQHTSFDAETDFTKKGSYTRGNGKFFSYDGSLQLDYNKRFGKHLLTNSTGSSISETNSDYLRVYVEGFPNDKLDEISFGNGYPANSKPSFSSTVTRMISAYTNFNYSYNSRYNADLSIRTDGSSQFGSNKRFGTFWSAGFSWNLYKEKFLANNSCFNLVRFRGSLGTTGDNKFQPYMGVTTYQYYTDQNYRGQIGAILKGYGNQNLQWQQTLKRNIGIDLGIFRSLITASFDIYRENTSNLILDITTPPSVGYSSYKENVGELQNDGFEFRLNAFLFRNEKKNLHWSVFVNGLHNNDYIKKISNSLKKLNQLNDANSTSSTSPDYNKQSAPQFRFEEGQSVNSIWAVRSMGIDPSNGRELYLKKDGSTTYTWDVADKVVVGNTVPDLRGSFGTNFNWKGFTLGLYFSYEFGADIYNQTLVDRVEVTSFTYNADRRVLLGRWKTPGDVTYFKGLVDENGATVTSATYATSRFVQKNNFINAESVSVGYLLSEKLNKKIGLNNTRISFITNDLKRWSSIQIERGLAYPFARNFTIQISTTL